MTIPVVARPSPPHALHPRHVTFISSINSPSLGAGRRATSRRLRWAIAALALTGACASSFKTPPPVAPSVRPVGSGISDWVAEAGDIVRLRAWLTTDQSGDLPVNERGEVLVPTVGRLKVTGLTPAAVEAAIIRAYANRLDSTRIDVSFLRPISIMGGVKNPGVQLADPSSTVLSLVSRAGGPLRPQGDLKVYLLRVDEPTREVSVADRAAELGVRTSDQLYVEDPPFVVRHEAAIRTTLDLLAALASTLTIVLLIRRP